jgi:hypothetical protein
VIVIGKTLQFTVVIGEAIQLDLIGGGHETSQQRGDFLM